MKKLSLMLLVIAFITGCQNSLKDSGNIEVTLIGADEFPKALVGEWKERDGVWEIHFLKDGTISNVTIEFGNIQLSPGKTTVSPAWYGGKGIYEPGQWNVVYDHSTNDLSVEIVIEKFYQDIHNESIDGKRTDILIGDLNQDMNVWTVEWYVKHTFYANLKNGKKVLFDNQIEPLYKRTIIFEKIESDTIPKSEHKEDN